MSDPAPSPPAVPPVPAPAAPASGAPSLGVPAAVPGVPVLCGSLSRYPVGLGRAMHEAGYRSLGLDYRYQPFQVDDIGAALAAMRSLGIRGCGVSMPFKLEVLPYLDEVDPLAGRIGAVNTVVNEGGRLIGYNTDAWGARRAFEEVCPLAGCRVLVLGAGGAARAVAFAFVSAGAHLTIANRDPRRGQALAEDVGAQAAGDSSLSARLDSFDAVVNASSRGMADVDPTSPIEPSQLRHDLTVMDIVYKPIQTELIRTAVTLGCPTVHGGRMLLHQATRQFELYTGCPAPTEQMDEELHRALTA